MRYSIALLVLPFLAAAQNNSTAPGPAPTGPTGLTFDQCATTCIPPQLLQECGANAQCYCGKPGAETIPSCFQGECPEIWQGIQGTFDCGATTSVTGSSGAPMPTQPGTNGTMTTTTGRTTMAAPEPTTTKKGGNDTSNTMSSEYSTVTEPPSSTDSSGNSTGTATKPSTSSTGAAAILEVAMQWPIAIVLGLAGAAAL